MEWFELGCGGLVENLEGYKLKDINGEIGYGSLGIFVVVLFIIY